MAGNFNPYRFLDPASQNTTGRGGRGTSLGGVTYLGSSGSGSMGRDNGRRISARPTFLTADAFYNARGSGLDYLEDNGPNRGAPDQGNPLGPATYGGQPASSLGSVGGNITGNNTPSAASSLIPGLGDVSSVSPSTSTGPVSSPNDYTPQGRRTRMNLEQQALMAQGLAEGKAAVAGVQQVQNAPPTPSGASIIPSVGGNGPGSDLRSRYGTGAFSQFGGGPRSFGATRASSPEQSRQDDIGERAIASRNRAGVSTSSLLDSYYRRFGRR